MKRIFKTIAIIVALSLTIGILFVTNAFVGNPISKYLVDKNSDEYLEEQYPDLDLVKEIGFDFKSTRYYVQLKSETIEDLYFTLYYSLTGKLDRDLYENNITNGWNVITRLDEDYRTETDIIFEELKNNPLFKDAEHFYTSSHLISKIELEDRLVGAEDVLGGIDGTTLELSKDYDISEIGGIGGVLDINVRFTDGDESYERAAVAMKEIKAAFDDGDIGFYYINFSIINEEGNFTYGFELFPYSEIDSEDLAEKLKIAHESNPTGYDK